MISRKQWNSSQQFSFFFYQEMLQLLIFITEIFLKMFDNRNFCVNLKQLISISDVGTFKFEDQCLVPRISYSCKDIEDG